MIKEEVKDEQNELRDFVEYMVLHTEDESEIQTVTGLDMDLKEAKSKLTSIGQVLNDSKAQIV
eukprot:8000205-Heterocapsa_arctica.AAC.1